MFFLVPRCELVHRTASVLHWIKFMCAIEACVAAAGILHLFNGLARLPFPRPSFRKNLSFLGHAMAWHPLSQSDIFPFLSFFRKTTKKRLPSQPHPLVWNDERSTLILHVFLIKTNPGFLALVLCVLCPPSSPSASPDHHLTHLQLFLMVSARRKSTTLHLDELHLSPLQNPFPESTNASSSE